MGIGRQCGGTQANNQVTLLFGMKHAWLYRQHGKGQKAKRLKAEMLKKRVRPDINYSPFYLCPLDEFARDDRVMS